MASLPYPRTPLSHACPLFPHACTSLSSASRSSFPFSPHLFSSSYSLLLSSASTDADARIDRRGCSYRPARMLVATDADARIDRRGCSYRPTRVIFVDVSQCQTFTFAVPNRCFCGSRPPFLHFILSFSCNIFLCFLRSVVLSCCVHPLVAVLKTASFVYNIIMCASTMRRLNCKQLLKRA